MLGISKKKKNGSKPSQRRLSLRGLQHGKKKEEGGSGITTLHRRTGKKRKASIATFTPFLSLGCSTDPDKIEKKEEGEK